MQKDNNWKVYVSTTLCSVNNLPASKFDKIDKELCECRLYDIVQVSLIPLNKKNVC